MNLDISSYIYSSWINANYDIRVTSFAITKFNREWKYGAGAAQKKRSAAVEDWQLMSLRRWRRNSILRLRWEFRCTVRRFDRFFPHLARNRRSLVFESARIFAQRASRRHDRKILAGTRVRSSRACARSEPNHFCCLHPLSLSFRLYFLSSARAFRTLARG